MLGEQGGIERICIRILSPSSVSTSGSNQQVSSMRPRLGTASSLSDMVEMMKLQMVTDAAERKSKREQMEMDRKDRIEERRVAMEQLKFKREQIAAEGIDKAADRAALTTMIASAVGSYFGVKVKKTRKKKRKMQKGRSRKRVDKNIDGSGSSSSDTNSIK